MLYNTVEKTCCRIDKNTAKETGWTLKQGFLLTNHYLATLYKQLLLPAVEGNLSSPVFFSFFVGNKQVSVLQPVLVANRMSKAPRILNIIGFTFLQGHKNSSDILRDSCRPGQF